MRYRQLVNLAISVQAMILMAPSAALYVAGALIWFPFFVFGIVPGLFQTAMRVGFGEAWKRAIDMPMNYWGMNAFMIGAGIGFISVSLIYRAGYEGKSLKNIRWWVWCGLLIGLVTAALVTQPQSLLHIQPPHGISLTGHLFVPYILGIGPMISSVLAIIWLYWIGRFQGENNGKPPKKLSPS